MSEPRLSDRTPRKIRYRFGFRWLLLVVVVLSIVFAWFARESRRVKRQARLIDDLAMIEVRVRGREPTGFALAARKLLGERDVWLSQRMDEGWFSRPRVLVTWTATDDQISKIVEQIKKLGVVGELHLEQSPVTDEGLAALKDELREVAVLTRADLIRPRPGELTEHFGGAAIEFISITAAGLLCLFIVFLWPFFRCRRQRCRSQVSPKTS